MTPVKVNPWVVAIVVTLASFMEVLDTSVANVALPYIGGGLSASQDESTWVLTSYLVSNAVVVPLSAWLMSTVGRKRFYMACVAAFTLSSLACGLAPSLGWLIVFRVLQGLGGGGLAPSAQAILVDTFPVEKRASSFAVYSLTVVTAPAAGPVLGGWITDHWSWRWTFFINIPIGIIALALSSRLLTDPEWVTEQVKKARSSGFWSKIDYLGVGLAAIGLGCLEVVLDKGQEDDWFGSPFICVFAALAAVGLVGGVIWEWRNKDAAIDLSLLKERNFAIACALYFTTTLVLFAQTLLAPLLMQTQFGYTATDAGLVLSPGAVVLVALTLVTARVVRKTGAKALLIPGLIGVALSGVLMAQVVDPRLDYRTAIMPRLVFGAGLAAFFVPNSLIAYSRLPKEKNNKASSLTQLFRNLGGSFGIALATTFMARREQFHQAMLTPHVSASDPWLGAWFNGLVQRLQDAGLGIAEATGRAESMLYASVSRQAALLAYRDVFYVLGVMTLLTIPFVFLIKPALGGGKPPEGAH